MNARTLLIPRTLLILSLVVLSGAPCASAQSFKERLKNAAKKIEQKVKQEVAPKKLPEKSGNTSSLDSELQKRHDAMVGPATIRTLKTKLPPSGCRRPTLLFLRHSDTLSRQRMGSNR